MSGFVNLYSLLSWDIQTNLLFFLKKLAYFFLNVNFGPFNWHLYLNVAKFGHDINTSYGQSHIRVGVLKFRMAMTKHKKYSRPAQSANWNLLTELNSQASIIFNE